MGVSMDVFSELTVEPLVEHGEDFAGRLQQLQELFRSAAELPGGIVYSS